MRLAAATRQRREGRLASMPILDLTHRPVPPAAAHPLGRNWAPGHSPEDRPRIGIGQPSGSALPAADLAEGLAEVLSAGNFGPAVPRGLTLALEGSLAQWVEFRAVL